MKAVILILLTLLLPLPPQGSTATIPRYSISDNYAMGVSSSFNISTNKVLGYVAIYAISTSSASLQFNTVIKAENNFGQTFDFWVQNVIEFNGN